jgi:hypothetical protein
MFSGFESLWLFPLGLPQRSCVLHQPTVQELQAKTEAVAEVITGDMLHDTADKFVVHLQQVHEVEGSHTEHLFTLRPHAHKISMKVCFHLCITSYHKLKQMYAFLNTP